MELSSTKKSIHSIHTSSSAFVRFTSFGYPLVIGKMDTTTAYYLASGSVLMGVISIGCTISSPVIANAKSEGHVDYIRALPIPRILISLADLCIWLIAILPGVFFTFY